MSDPTDFERDARVRVTAVDPDADVGLMIATLDLFRATNRLLQDFEAQVHRPIGLTWAGFRVLFGLWVRPSARPAELARLTGVSRASMSSVLNTLERKDYIVRERATDDARQVRVILLPAGHEIVGRALKTQHLRERAWLDDVSDEDMQTFVGVLRKVLAKPGPNDGEDEDG